MAAKAAQRLTNAFRKLEVESKFTPTSHSLSLLAHNSGTPPFGSLRHVDQRVFHDEYFDYDRILERRGVWVRKREGVWEAKIRRSGDFVDSVFEEREGAESVGRIVWEKMVLGVGRNIGLGELKRTAAFTTTRESWVADEVFNVVVDVADFGHRVGEVELVRDVVSVMDMGGWEVSKANEAVVADARKRVTKEMRQELGIFMERYRWAFSSKGKPVGKLSAYFKRFGYPE